MSNPYMMTLLGRPVEEWSKIDDIMKKHGVSTPAALDKALSRPAPEDMIDVVDSKNHDRILGRVPRIGFSSPTHDRLRMAVCPPMRLIHGLRPHEPFPYTTVDFTVAWRTEPDGLGRKAILATSAPLGVLMMVQHFLLPGETEAAASERRYRA